MAYEIDSYLAPGKSAHLIGIGGVSMSPLAEVLQGMGVQVTGSDMRESPAVQHLRTLGIQIFIEHKAENVGEVDCIVRTAAVHDDNPEVARAKARGIPVFERAQAWGAIMKGYENALCVSGTHGKTSTTSMCTHIAMAAQLDPSVMIGGTLPLLGSGHRVGKGDTIILESCEYCNSFHSFFPTVAVILNVEADHLDFFKDLEDVKSSFRTFANRIPERGMIVANREDVNTMSALEGLGRPITTFGIQEGDITTANLTFTQGLASFDVLAHGNHYAHITLQVPGLHNVKNALAATAAAYVLGIPAQAVEMGLGGYLGVGRRFEFKGTCNGAQVYDDYAHHPGELSVLLDTAHTLGYKRVICAFQPHTYTRTLSLFDDFIAQLKKPDITLLAEIYAAREENLHNTSSQDLAVHIPGSIYCPTLKSVSEQLTALAQPGDLILTVGAGDIYTAGEAIVEH